MRKFRFLKKHLYAIELAIHVVSKWIDFNCTEQTKSSLTFILARLAFSEPSFSSRDDYD